MYSTFKFHYTWLTAGIPPTISDGVYVLNLDHMQSGTVSQTTRWLQPGGRLRKFAQDLICLSIRQTVLQNSWKNTTSKFIEHPFYSLVLAPCDFWLFPALKKALREWKFHFNREPLTTTTQAFFNCWLESRFRKTIKDKCPEHTQKCILSRGRYFENEGSKNKDVRNNSE